MYITERNTCERARWSEFYGSTINPNEQPARKALLWLLPLALVVAGLFMFALWQGSIKMSSLFVVGALLFGFTGSLLKRP